MYASWKTKTLINYMYSYSKTYKVKVIPLQARCGPEGG